jgi:glucan phosphoethanolaminetransferase (alkaline phosphatase superfamily)
LRYSGCLLAGLALLLAPYVAIAAWLTRAERMRSLAAYVATVSLVMLLVAFAARTWRRFLLVQLPLLLLSAAFAAYTLTYGHPPGYMIAYVLLTSSWDEVKGFFSIWQGERILISALLLSVLYLTVALRSPNDPIASRRGGPYRRTVLASIVLLSVYAARSSADFMDGLAANPTLGSALFVVGPISNARAALRGTAIRKVPYGATRVSADEVHILVIGESARRDSWSAYGYSRQTTPRLDRLKGEAIFFSNVVADANFTTAAVPILLTGMHPDSFDLGAVRGNLVDLAKEAGYSTTWLLNQDIGPSLLVGLAADRTVYPQTLRQAGLGQLPPDGVLLPALGKELARSAGSPRFIGMHTIGSHWEYFERYPSGFGHFEPSRGLNIMSAFLGGKVDQRVVNAYDNSVLYTDWFLGQVIDQARKLTVPATVTYVADHGEDLYALDGRAGHGTPTYSRRQFEIPAFVWVNAAYRRVHPDKVHAMEQNAARQIRTHNFFYSLADLMGIRWPGASVTESFASPRFVPDEKLRVIAGGNLVAPDCAAPRSPCLATSGGLPPR